MRRSDTFIRAAKSLRDSKMRTVLTSLAIAVGATTITLAMAAGTAGREYIKNQPELPINNWPTRVKKKVRIILVTYNWRDRFHKSFAATLNGWFNSLRPRTMPKTIPETKKKPSAVDTYSILLPVNQLSPLG